MNSLKATLTSFFLLFGAVGILLFASFATHAQSETFEKWQYQQKIILPDMEQKAFVELELNENIFSNTTDGLADLRIINANRDLIPHKLQIARSKNEITTRQTTSFDKQETDETTTLTVDLQETGLLHNQLTIETPTKNFRTKTTIEVSNDLSTWSTVAEDKTIYNYSDPDIGLNASNTTVSYPESTYRYIKVTIKKQGDTTVIPDSVEVQYQEQTEGTLTQYQNVQLQTEQNQETKTTIHTISLPVSGLPHTTLTLQTNDQNFQRNVLLEGSNDLETWKPLSNRDVLFSFNTTKVIDSKLSLTYPETTVQYLRLTVFNGDNVPVKLESPTVTGILRTLVFEADPTETYMLLYGNPAAQYPVYDLESFFELLDTDNLQMATLGSQEINPFYIQVTPTPPPVTEQYPWLLPVVIAIGIIIITLLLISVYRSVKEIKPISDEDEQVVVNQKLKKKLDS